MQGTFFWNTFVVYYYNEINRPSRNIWSTENNLSCELKDSFHCLKNKDQDSSKECQRDSEDFKESAKLFTGVIEKQNHSVCSATTQTSTLFLATNKHASLSIIGFLKNPSKLNIFLDF